LGGAPYVVFLLCSSLFGFEDLGWPTSPLPGCGAAGSASAVPLREKYAFRLALRAWPTNRGGGGDSRTAGEAGLLGGGDALRRRAMRAPSALSARARRRAPSPLSSRAPNGEAWLMERGAAAPP
jgi:hypothetical protein